MPRSPAGRLFVGSINQIIPRRVLMKMPHPINVIFDKESSFIVFLYMVGAERFELPNTGIKTQRLWPLDDAPVFLEFS